MMNQPMNQILKSSRLGRRFLLIAILLAGLSLSSSAGLVSAPAYSGAAPAEQSSLGSANVLMRDLALTTAANSSAQSQSSRHNRPRHPAGHSRIIVRSITPPDAKVSRFATACEASPVYSSICLSRPRGRAPPQLA